MASSSNFVNDVMVYNNLGAGSVYNKPESNATAMEFDVVFSSY